MIQLSKKLIGKSYLILALAFSASYASSDILDLYMMGVLPAITSSNSEPVIAPVVSSDPVVNMASYHSTSVNSVHTLKGYIDTNIQLVGIASNNFVQTVDSYDMTSADLLLFEDKLLDNLPKMAASLLYINHLNELNAKIPESSMKIGQVIVQPRIAFVTVVLLAGIALTLEQGIEALYDGIQDYNKIGESGVSNARGAELEDINVNVLHISRNATPQEALDKYNSLDFMTKARLVGHISKINAESGDGQIEPERKKGYTKLAVTGGNVAIKGTVGLATAATGQGVDKVGQALGLSANAAAVMDLGVTILGRQPLDYVLMATESKEKILKRVPAPTVTHQVAIETLDRLRKRQDVKIEEVIEASKKIANETARLMPDAKILADESVEVLMSVKTDLSFIEKIEDGDILKVRDLDTFDIVLIANNMYPVRFTDLSKVGLGVLLLDPEILPICPVAQPEGSMWYFEFNPIDKDGDGTYEDYIWCEYYGGDGSRLKRDLPYVDSKRHGMDKYYYESGQRKSAAPYVNGLIEGIKKWYYESGKLQGTGPYVNGKREGISKEYYESGVLEWKSPYVNGYLHGVRMHYYESGSIETETSYVNSWKTGIYKLYYESGGLHEETSYLNWKKHGESRLYRESDGKMYQCRVYDMGSYVESCMPE